MFMIADTFAGLTVATVVRQPGVRYAREQLLRVDRRPLPRAERRARRSSCSARSPTPARTGMTLSELGRVARRLEEQRVRDPADAARPRLRRRRGRGHVAPLPPRHGARAARRRRRLADRAARRRAAGAARPDRRRPGSPRGVAVLDGAVRRRDRPRRRRRAARCASRRTSFKRELDALLGGRQGDARGAPRAARCARSCSQAGMPQKTPHTITDVDALLRELADVCGARLRDRRRGGRRGRLLRRRGDRASTARALRRRDQRHGPEGSTSRPGGCTRSAGACASTPSGSRRCSAPPQAVPA